MERYDASEKYLVKTDATDPLFRCLIRDERVSSRERKECIQLLHHVFTFGAKEGLMLIGDRDELMCVIQVHFSEALRQAYSNIVKYMLDTYFVKFYEESADLPMTEIESALEALNGSTGKGIVDLHAFQTNYMLWRAFNVDVDKEAIKFPLLPCARLIPFQNADWNVMKGPSDTLTDLLDRCEEQVGIRTPQTVATARLLGILALAWHRGGQMLTAKDDLTFYETLKDFRHAANQRMALHKSYSDLISMLKMELKSSKTIRLPPQMPPAAVTPQRRTRNTVDYQSKGWYYAKKTGFTPCRGRPGKSSKTHALFARRNETCSGLVLVFRVGDPNNKLGGRGKCRLCGSTTNYYCTGCKNYYCANISNFARKLENITQTLGVGVASSEPPSEFVRFTETSRDGTSNHHFVKNTCYLIGHQHQFDEHWAQLNAASSDEE